MEIIIMGVLIAIGVMILVFGIVITKSLAILIKENRSSKIKITTYIKEIAENILLKDD